MYRGNVPNVGGGIVGDPSGQALMQPFPPNHQLATFAPSKQDILGTLEFFFGKPGQPEKLTDFSDHHAATYHFPDAFLGKNVYLRDTLNNLIMQSPQNWQTSTALPFLRIEGVTVAWDEIHFDVRLLQRVPYEGASRMQTSIKRSHRDRVVRRGIAMMVESDFYRTDVGRKYFYDQIKSIQYCVQETCNFDVLYAYLTTHNYDHHWDVTKNLIPHRNIIHAMKNEVTLFACVQKDARGLDLAVEKAKQRMARYQVTPNMMVMAPETQLYITMVPPEMRTYADRGERGPSQFDSYNGGASIANFRGLDIFTSNPFDAGDNIDAVQMLRRNTQVGEFYVMQPPWTWDPKEALPNTYMDILIYDEHRDRLAHIGFREAMRHACPWMLPLAAGARAAMDRAARVMQGQPALPDESIEVVDPFKIKRTSGPPNNQTYQWAANVRASLNALFANGVTTIARYAGDAIDLRDTNAAANAILGEFGYGRVHFMNFVRFAEQGVWIPLTIVLARPFIEHQMLSAIVAVKGSDTGNTLFGPADMQIAANTTVKTIEGHYTCHTKAVITKPQNVMVLRDIQCDGYVAGADAVFFGDISLPTDSQADTADGDNELLDAIGQDVRDRLEFAHEYDNQYGSILAFAAPLEDNPQFLQDQAFSLSGQRLPWDVGDTDILRMPNGGGRYAQRNGSRNFPGSDAFFGQYAALFKLSTITAGQDTTSITANQFIRNGTYNNSIVLLGPHRCYSPFTSSHFDLTPGQGHFGPDALPGDARWRRGESIDAASARGALVGVEALAESKKAFHRIAPRI